MQSFDARGPITATIDVVLGDVRITTGEGDTVVDVQPNDASNRDDLKAAELTRVECANEHLVVKAPKLRSWLPRSDGGSIAVRIELPAGSNVRATGQFADFQCDGRLGECRIKTGMGRVELDQVDTLSVKSGLGDIGVGRVAAHADVATGSGDVRLRDLADSGVVKNSNGDTWVGAAAGELLAQRRQREYRDRPGGGRRGRQVLQRRRPARRGRAWHGGARDPARRRGGRCPRRHRRLA